MGSKLTNILLGILAIAILAIVFIFFSGNKETATNGLRAQSATGGSPIGAFLKQVSAIRNISLNSDVFNDPVLKSLRDQSKPIPSENKGRINPFAPLSRQVAYSSGSSDTSTVKAQVVLPLNPTPTPTPTPGALSD